jgi:uncharacterized protein
MRRSKPDSFSTKLNLLTLPARQRLGQALGSWQRLPRIHKAGLLILLPAWLLLLTWQPGPTPLAVPVTGSLILPLSAAEKREIPVPDGGKRLDHTLAQGETLAALFRQWQLPGHDLIALVRAEPSYKPLSNLRAGQDLTLVLNGDGQLHYLEVRDKGLLLNAFRRMGQEFSMLTTQ